MQRILKLVTIAACVTLASVALLAQGNPLDGTWKLNLTKSKFAGSPPPKSETRTVEAQGTAEKITFQGVAADGSAINYTFTTNLDGKPTPITGSGVPGGADTESVKQINANTHTATLTKAGKPVSTARVVVSADGKVTTQTRKFTDANGNPVTQVLIWEKQ
jgi:hypothetical protein